MLFLDGRELFPFLIGRMLTLISGFASFSILMFPFLIGRMLTTRILLDAGINPDVSIPYR